MSNLSKTNRLFPTFTTLWDDFLNKDLQDWNNFNFTGQGNTMPGVNVKETDKDFQVEMAVPGMKKEDFIIKVDNNLLTVSSEKQDETSEKDKEGRYIRREFSYQSFQRAFSLPEHCDKDNIDASYANGILHIVIAKKSAETKPAGRQIDIK